MGNKSIPDKNLIKNVPVSEGSEVFASPDYRDTVTHLGDGREDCPHCFGRGVVRKPSDGVKGPPVVLRCSCVKRIDLARNMNRACPGLIKARKVKESPLDSYTEDNLWVTSSRSVFQSFLRKTAINKGPRWNFKVATDVDIMAAWLSSAKIKGADIKDPEIASRETTRYLSLEDIIKPYQLLVLELGVKSARNAAMPEVFLEAVRIRASLNLPLWIVDHPQHKLAPGHLCWSEQVDDLVHHGWEHFYIDLGHISSPSLRKTVIFDMPDFLTKEEESEEDQIEDREENKPERTAKERHQSRRNVPQSQRSLYSLGDGKSTDRAAKATKAYKMKADNEGKKR